MTEVFLVQLSTVSKEINLYFIQLLNHSVRWRGVVMNQGESSQLLLDRSVSMA